MASVTLARPEATTPIKGGNIKSINTNIFMKRISSYVKQQDIIDDGVQKTYSLIVGQRS